MTMLQTAHLRIARATDQLDSVLKFYRDGLGFEVISSFQDHSGYDGVMLGQEGAGYHLEFTQHQHERAGRAPTQENLLVFYLPDRVDWHTLIERLAALGHTPVASANPYWDVDGVTFEDPDGYRVVLQNASWP